MVWQETHRRRDLNGVNINVNDPLSEADTFRAETPEILTYSD